MTRPAEETEYWRFVNSLIVGGQIVKSNELNDVLAILWVALGRDIVDFDAILKLKGWKRLMLTDFVPAIRQLQADQ